MYTYCPKCGEKYSDTSNTNAFTCEHCGFVLYNNPKPTVIALITNSAGDVLFTRRAIEPSLGNWGLPGGFIEYGESPEDAIKRELLEELGVRSNITDTIGTFHALYENEGRKEETYSVIVIVLTAILHPGDIISPADDIDTYEYFSPSDLPTNIAFPEQQEFLERILKK